MKNLTTAQRTLILEALNSQLEEEINGIANAGPGEYAKKLLHKCNDLLAMIELLAIEETLEDATIPESTGLSDAEKLNRLLRDFSMKNGGDSITWGSYTHRNYIICYSHRENKWYVEPTATTERLGCVTFASLPVAVRAIEEVVFPFIKAHPDFTM